MELLDEIASRGHQDVGGGPDLRHLLRKGIGTSPAGKTGPFRTWAGDLFFALTPLSDRRQAHRADCA